MKKRLLSRKRPTQLVLSLCMILLYINASWGQTPITVPNGDFSSGSTLTGTSPWTTITGWKITQNGTINAVATGGNAAITAASSGVISNALTLVGTNSINGTSNNNNQAAVCLESDKIDISSYAGSTTAFTFAFNMKLSAAASGASPFNVLIRVYDAIGTDITLTALSAPNKVQGKYNAANYASPFGYKSNSIVASLNGAGAPATISLQVHFGQILMNGATNLNPTIDDVTLSAAGAAASTTLTPPANTALSYEFGNGPSAEQSFQVAGANLGSNNVTVTPGANIEISSTSGSGFGSSAITLTPSGGTVATTTLYARLIAGLGLGSAGANATRQVNVAATGTTTKTVQFTGSINGINTTTITGSALSYVAGSGPSAEGSFTVTTNGLTSGLVVTPGSNLEVSTISGTGFVSTAITLPSTTTSQVIYSRLKAGLSAGSYSGASTAVVVSSTGVTGVTKQFNGTVTDPTTTWNGTIWSNGAPTLSTLAVIDGDYSTGTNNAFSAKTLTVNATRTFTINTGQNITVADAVTNNGTLTIDNNANLIQTAEVNTNSGSGSATVTRNSNPLLRLDYTMWSSPVSGTQTLEQFSPNTSRVPNRFYTYDALNNVYANIATTSNFSAGSGYLIRMPNDADAVTPTAFAGVFTGTSLNNGNISLTGLTADKFYLVGNPYASTIGADAFLSVNSTAGTLYFWRKTNGALGSAYATYTLTGGTGTTAGSAALEPNGTIQVGQGFIVKTADTSLNFTNAMRLGTASTQFFKTRNVTEKSRVWLNLTNTAGLFSQALVGYLDGATQGVDNVYDGKYINDSATALTSIIEGGEYTIQGRPAFDATDVVALGFKTDVAGDFTIAMDHKDGVFAAAQDIYLVDSKTGIETDLNASSYTFAADAGVDNTRFSLKYQKTLKVGTQTFDENTVNVYKNNGTIYVNSAAKTIKTIEVYDVQGRLIVKQMNVKANTAAISNLKAVRQMLLLKVSADDNSVVTKKILN